MAEVQYIEEENQRQLDNQQEQVQRGNPIAVSEQATPNLDHQNPAMNPTAELHKTNYDNIEEFIRRYGAVGLDWYVPNLSNTRMKDLIRDRLPIDAFRGKILFTAPQLREYFTTSTFEIDFTMGQVYTYFKLDSEEATHCHHCQLISCMYIKGLVNTNDESNVCMCEMMLKESKETLTV